MRSVRLPLSSLALAAALALAAFVTLPAGAADQFYEARLQEGRITYQTGDAAEAADLLRIACFGLLDQPAELSEGLVWLTLAQSKAGRTVDADHTLRRFLDVEKRFGTYSRAGIPPRIRTEFEGLLAKRLPPEALASVPTLAGLVETEEQKIGKLPPASRVKALEAKAKASPKELVWPLTLARLQSEQKNVREAVRWGSRALEIDAGNVEARTLRARALFSRREFVEALDDIGKLPPELLKADPSLAADAFVCLVETSRWDGARAALGGIGEAEFKRPDVAAAARKIPPEKKEKLEKGDGKTTSAPEEKAPDPSEAAAPARTERDSRRVLLEAAILAKDWKTAVVEGTALSPFRDGEEPLMFYAAVGLYESGRTEEARSLMRRAYPRISRNAFVEHYAKILLP